MKILIIVDDGFTHEIINQIKHADKGNHKRRRDG